MQPLYIKNCIEFQPEPNLNLNHCTQPNQDVRNAALESYLGPSEDHHGTTDKVGVYVRNVTKVCMSVSMHTNTHSPLERDVISQLLLSSPLTFPKLCRMKTFPFLLISPDTLHFLIYAHAKRTKGTQSATRV